MTAVLVDSNVLLDVLTGDPVWAARSGASLEDVVSNSVPVINPVIYAEVSIGFRRIEDLDDAVPPDVFRREPLPWPAGFLAGKSFVDYRRRGGPRQAPLPDFYVGAHAAVAGYRLLTRDRARYRTYFPSVELLAP
ncbi:MAG: type II toxin-antitoxin system VapC family toxin [Acidimicrobiia bacterium]